MGQAELQRSYLPVSDVNWLLHRAAQRFGEAMEQAATRHGGSMRGYLVLSVLVKDPGRSQLAICSALALDKTTLTSVLDRLEQHGMVIRRPDPTDRRVRIPEITDAGRELQQRIGAAVRTVENELLGTLAEGDQEQLRAILLRLIGGEHGAAAPSAGSCI
ncbi:MAG TPA: MarR family transcriptional regulator [Pseudonocardiaceae bacterium]|nr:MarR family transcriptional regulator [Pseudonocardiaceae bacterium]